MQVYRVILVLLAALHSCQAGQYHFVASWAQEVGSLMQQFFELNNYTRDNPTCFGAHQITFSTFNSSDKHDFLNAYREYANLKGKNVLAIGGELKHIIRLVANELNTGLPAGSPGPNKTFQMELHPVTLKTAAHIMAHMLEDFKFLNEETGVVLDPAWGSATEVEKLFAKIKKFTFPVIYKHRSESMMPAESITDDVIHGLLSSGITQFVSFVAQDKLFSFLRHLQEYGLFEPNYRWFFFISGLQNLNESEILTYFKSPSENITLLELYHEALGGNTDEMSNGAIINDMIKIFMRYFEYWLCGKDIPEKGETMKGITGYFHLNKTSAERLTWSMQIHRGVGVNYSTVIGKLHYHLNEANLKFLNESTKITSLRPPNLTPEHKIKLLQLRGMRFLTIIEPPFVMYHVNASADDPLLDQLDGYCIKVLKEVCKRLNISCTIELEPSGTYGDAHSKNLRDWTGMLRELMLKRYDVAVTAWRRDEHRDQIADALIPFMLYKKSLLMLDPHKNRRVIYNMFQFMHPLDKWMWTGLVGCVVFVAIVQMLLDCCMPNSTRFMFYDSFFFNATNLVMGATFALPDRVSGRMVVTFFWFFTLIFALFYICNYGSFAITKRLQPDIRSLKDLPTQTKVQYGTISGSNTAGGLQDSPFQYVQQIYLNMENNGRLWNTSQFAVSLIINKPQDNFALIYDEPINMHYKYLFCNLTSVASYDEGRYTFYVPKDFVYKDTLNDVIQQMITEGWMADEWKKSVAALHVDQNPKCLDESITSKILKLLALETNMKMDPGALSLEHTAGIFVIMLAGCIIAILLAVIECIYALICKCCKKRRIERNAMKEADKLRGRRTKKLSNIEESEI